MTKYRLEYNLDRDIWNWYYGANYSENGENNLKAVDDLEVLKKIKGLKHSKRLSRFYARSCRESSIIQKAN